MNSHIDNPPILFVNRLFEILEYLPEFYEVYLHNGPLHDTELHIYVHKIYHFL